MSMIAHFEVLNKKHAWLDAAIQRAYAHHLPDTIVSDLKKQKLRVKEEIYMLDMKLKITAYNLKQAA